LVKDYKLKWSDFQGNGDTALVIAAGCWSDINYDFRPMKNDTLLITISATFDKMKSFKNMFHLNEFDLVDQSLEHEQLHFDITELFARKFREKIAKLMPKAKRKYSDWLTYQLPTLYAEIFSKWQEEQKQFDKDVSFFHEINPSQTGAMTKEDIDNVKNKQNEWRKKIDNELKELDMYSSITMKLRVKENIGM